MVSNERFDCTVSNRYRRGLSLHCQIGKLWRRIVSSRIDDIYYFWRKTKSIFLQKVLIFFYTPIESLCHYIITSLLCVYTGPFCRGSLKGPWFGIFRVLTRRILCLDNRETVSDLVCRRRRTYMNSMKLVIPLYFISWKKTPNDAVTPQRQSQFTPKKKAVPRLLSSLVWIDPGVVVSQHRLESFFMK